MNRSLVKFAVVLSVAAALGLGTLGVGLAQPQTPSAPFGSGMMGPGGGPAHGPMHGPGSMVGGFGPGRPGASAATFEQHFIQEMIPHHEDAIVMADLALAQAEHPELKALAQRIKDVQAAEIVQMRAWYAEWYGGEVPPSMMEQMPGHQAMMGAPTAIDGATPFDKAFIEAMIPHHRMAVMMATMTSARTEHPELQGLLDSIATSQSEEIQQMLGWYQQWYPAPGR